MGSGDAPSTPHPTGIGRGGGILGSYHTSVHIIYVPVIPSNLTSEQTKAYVVVYVNLPVFPRLVHTSVLLLRVLPSRDIRMVR